MRNGLLISAAISLGLAAGCDRTDDRQDTRTPARAPTALYDRALTTFTAGVLYKPDDAFADAPAFALAPLIVQEMPADESAASPDARFGAIASDGRGRVRVDTERPTVYAGMSRVVLGGVEHEQAIYLWGYRRPADERGVRWRWIRITLDATGFPAIWEVCGSGGPMRELFVSRSLEEAAGKAFGPPLPGRRFCVERGLDERPHVVVVVVRVLEDGPQPMGPFVYVAAKDQAVTTLLCRCMPSQVDTILDSPYYDLLPLARLDTRPEGFTGSVLRGPAPGDVIDPSGLEHALRLPEHF